MAQFEDTKQKSIAKLCAPASQTPGPQHHKLSSLTQLGVGKLGSECRTITCVIRALTTPLGDFAGEEVYPVTDEIQQDPQVARMARNIELRAAVDSSHESKLVYSKLSARGRSSSWGTSASLVIAPMTQQWGQINADHLAGEYYFEPASMPFAAEPEFPNLDELIDEVLGEFVIDSLNHPVLLDLQRQSRSRGGRPNSRKLYSESEADDGEIY